MKKSWNILIILLVVAAVIIGVYYIGAAQFAVTSSLPAPESGKYYEVPTFGYFMCQEADFEINYPSDVKKGTTTISFGYAVVTCQQAATLAQDCVVRVTLPTSKEVSKANGYLLWQIEKKNNPIPSGSRANVEWVQQVFVRGASSGQTLTIPLPSDSYLVMNYIEENLFSALFNTGNTISGKTSYEIRFRPFFIYKYDIFSFTNGDRLTTSFDCRFDGNFQEQNAIVEFISSGVLSSQYSPYTIGADSLRSPGRRVAFLSNFVTIPSGQFTFLNDREYCKDSKVYEVTEVGTTRGTYLVADVGVNTAKRSVECCNDGDAIAKRGIGYYCDDNLRIQQYSSADIQCDRFNPCPMVGYVPGVDKQVYYQDCINNKCITGSFAVACSSNAHCAAGTYCDYDAANPRNSKCVGLQPTTFCGNNVCEASRGENEITCPADCRPKIPDEGIPNWVVYSLLVAAVLAIVVAFAATGKKQMVQ